MYINTYLYDFYIYPFIIKCSPKLKALENTTNIVENHKYANKNLLNELTIVYQTKKINWPIVLLTASLAANSI